MYGTVSKFKLKPGSADKMMDLMKDSPPREGHIATFVYALDSDPNNRIVCTVFENKAAYRKFADDPAEDKRFKKMRELLAADPEWNDGEVIHHEAEVGSLR